MTSHTQRKTIDENRELNISELSVVAGGTYTNPKPMSNHVKSSLGR